jgi:hypothetical protein
MNLSFNSRVQGIGQGIIWFITGWFMASVVVFQFFADGGRISALAAVSFIAIASFFSGIFATNGGIVAARKDYLDNKIQLEPADEEKASNQHLPRNPWLVAARDATIQWPVFAALGMVIGFGIFPEGLSSLAFGMVAAGIMGIHGAVVAGRTSGRELLKLIAHPPREALPFPRYLWREHIWGNAIANFAINIGFGYIIFHPGPKYNYYQIKTEHFLIDILIMSAIIAVLVAIGAAIQSATDVRGGRALAPQRKSNYHPNIVIRTLAYFGLAPCAAILSGASFFIVGIKTFTLFQVMIVKGIIAAIVAASAAGVAAYWSAARINRVKSGGG